EAPLLLTRGWIDGGQVAGHVLGIHRNARTPVRDALLELPAPSRCRGPDVLHRRVEQPRLRAVAGVRPFLGAGRAGPEVDGLTLLVREHPRRDLAAGVDLAP